MKHSTRKYILNEDNLRKAVMRSYRAKTAEQRRKKEVMEVMTNVDTFVKSTIKALSDGTYKVGEYRHFIIHEKKDRNISVLPYRDRCVQNLIKDAIEPIIMQHVTDDMYGGLPGRGIHTKPDNRSMIRRMRRVVSSRKYSWYWMGDITKFYDTLKNPVIMKAVERIIIDKFTLSLIRQFVWAQPTLAIGDPFSHLLANLVMSQLIRHLKDGHKQWEVVNFADNLIVFTRTKEDAQNAECIARSYAATHLRLHFHHGDSVHPISNTEGIHFCGRVYHTNGKVSLRKSTKQAIARKKKNLLSRASYQGVLRSANCKHLTSVIYDKTENTICRQTSQG